MSEQAEVKTIMRMPVDERADWVNSIYQRRLKARLVVGAQVLGLSWFCDTNVAGGGYWASWGGAGHRTGFERREDAEAVQAHAFFTGTGLNGSWRLVDHDSAELVPVTVTRSDWRTLCPTGGEVLLRTAVTQGHLPSGVFGTGAAAVRSIFTRLARMTMQDAERLMGAASTCGALRWLAIPDERRACVEGALAAGGGRAADVLGVRETVLAMREGLFDRISQWADWRDAAERAGARWLWDLGFQVAMVAAEACAAGGHESLSDADVARLLEPWVAGVDDGEVTRLWTDRWLAVLGPFDNPADHG